MEELGPTELDTAWEAALAPYARATEDQVVLFSGGVDSGLLAWELRSSPTTTLFTLGRPGSEDLVRAAEVAPRFGRAWTGVPLEDRALADAGAKARAELEELPPPRRSIFLGLAALFAAAPPGRLLLGQGADELFLGYAHYRGLSPAAAAERSAKDLHLLLEEDWPRTRRLGERFGHPAVDAPYLDAEFVRAVHRVPIEERLPGELTKTYLRRWALGRGLPEPVALRPKRALQFGMRVGTGRSRRPAP